MAIFNQGAEEIPRSAPPSTAETPQLGLRARWHQVRNRLLANPRFQMIVARIPLLRLIGQRKATELHHITAGFVYSQVLSACVESELLDHLQQQPLNLTSLQHKTGLPEEGLLRLLNAAESLKLVESYPANFWGLGELGAAMSANPGIAAMVRHHRLLYRDLADPIALLQARKPTELSQYWPYALQETPTKEGSEYSELMAASQSLIANHILDAYDLSRHNSFLDIAGGTGAFASAVLARHPQLEASVLDLKPVIESVNNATQSAISYIAGDMFAEPLPAGRDLITLIRVLHDHDDEPVQKLLTAAHKALKPGGRLLIAEPLAETKGSEPIGHAYFGLYLWAMGSGRPRNASEISSMVKKAGFTRVWEAPSNMPCLVRIFVADGPEA